MSPRPLARVLAVLAAATLAGGAAGAATLTESATAGGAFSPRWDRPTEVARGFETIRGTGSGNVFDTFLLSDLPAGPQKLTLTFTAPDKIGYAYSAGGAVLHSGSAFRWGWDGTYAANFQIDYYHRSRSYDLNLGDSFSGKLYLALNFTHGTDLAYTIAVPSNASPTTPSPVPLPGGAALMAGAVAALGALGLARRRHAAA
jgi:hypothetical protein